MYFIYCTKYKTVYTGLAPDGKHSMFSRFSDRTNNTTIQCCIFIDKKTAIDKLNDLHNEIMEIIDICKLEEYLLRNNMQVTYPAIVVNVNALSLPNDLKDDIITYLEVIGNAYYRWMPNAEYTPRRDEFNKILSDHNISLNEIIMLDFN